MLCSDDSIQFWRFLHEAIFGAFDGVRSCLGGAALAQDTLPDPEKGVRFTVAVENAYLTLQLH
jgi:hypothetical protein